ncbi:MAG: type II toxin-antitoxin system VapC family toxin [Bacteroidetes bacterium]|nr:type II toxin-antitoxin system VapC family toxin [Bacteroidota bacterium]
MASYLLDTHTLIWFLEGSPSLSSKAQKEIEDPNASRFVSIVSLWEIAIKISIGKLSLNISFQDLKYLLAQNDITILPISFDDTTATIVLPMHHRDPFDRIIITQAINHNLTIITKDPEFQNYTAQILW